MAMKLRKPLAKLKKGEGLIYEQKTKKRGISKSKTTNRRRCK